MRDMRCHTLISRWLRLNMSLFSSMYRFKSKSKCSKTRYRLRTGIKSAHQSQVHRCWRMRLAEQWSRTVCTWVVFNTR